MIEFNSNVGQLGCMLVGALCFFGIGLFLTVYPGKVVSLLARWLRVYQRMFKLSDSKLDSSSLPYQRSMLGGSISRFAQTGAQTPEDFPAAISYVRVFGVLFASLFGLALCLVFGLFVLSSFIGRRP